MNLEKIHRGWGTVVTGTLDEVLRPDNNWRWLGYNRKLLVFRLGYLRDLEIYHLISRFGKPWSRNNYLYSRELAYTISGTSALVLSEFSNRSVPLLGDKAMPWHADIPNLGIRSFPWRALYMVQNPNPEGGLTTFLNVTLPAINCSKKDLIHFASIEVENQSWYGDTDETVKHPLIKVHPITGQLSLRLNYFRDGRPETSNAWIRKTFVKGEERPNKEVLGPILKELSSRPDLVYTHKWQENDLVLYDNWSFVHRRTALDLKPDQERRFIRANIDHVKDDECPS